MCPFIPRLLKATSSHPFDGGWQKKKSPPGKLRKSLIWVDKAGGCSRGGSCSSTRWCYRTFSEYPKVDFFLKPTLSPEKAKKTAGKPKSNTQESRNLELINLPPGSNTCLPAIWIAEKCEMKCNFPKLTGIGKRSILKDIGWPIKVKTTRNFKRGAFLLQETK